MDLKTFIERLGDERAAVVLKSNPRTVRSWRLGERVPKPIKAQEIESLTKRKVRFQECYA